MDTVTHGLMGGTLVGLATIDPQVDAVTVGFAATIVGASLIPDIDTVLKFKDNATYIKNHRGITHSLPFTFVIWPLLLATLSNVLFGLDFFHMYLWSLLAVFLHVFVDIFNMYGTQALRFFDNRWIQLGLINTIDIPIMTLLILHLMLWAFGFNPVTWFFIIYGIIVIYYVVRALYKQMLMKKVSRLLPNDEILRLFVMPTLKFFEWRIALVTKDKFIVGRAFKAQVVIYDEFDKIGPLEKDLYQIVKDNKDFRAFSYFSSIYRYEITEIDESRLEVRYIDLRYLKNGHYPFVCILILNKDNQTIESSFTGWVFSEEKLQQKIA